MHEINITSPPFREPADVSYPRATPLHVAGSVWRVPCQANNPAINGCR